mgnify:CR=1 FL=1
MVEGRRELMHCLSRGYTVETVFLCPDILRAEQEYDSLMHTLPSCNTIHVAPNVYEDFANLLKELSFKRDYEEL